MKSIQFVLFKSIIILFFIFSPGKTFSQSTPENTIRLETTNSISFAGFRGDYLLFDMQLTELPMKGCTITITDESGNLFFEESVNGNSITRRYKIAREGFSRINFKVAARGRTFNQSFTIKKEEKLLVIAE